MENNENLNTQPASNNVKKRVAIVILIIGLLLLGVAGYKLFIEKPDTDKPADNNIQEENNENDEILDNEKYVAYDYDEVLANMKKNVYFEHEISSDKLPRELEVNFANEDYQMVLSTDGKVTIKKGEIKKTLNISEVKNIEYCNDMYVRLYLLLNNGDVYEYVLENYDNDMLDAAKITQIKNATKFVKLSWADCTECGINIDLGVIDNNNKYIELDSVGY